LAICFFALAMRVEGTFMRAPPVPHHLHGDGGHCLAGLPDEGVRPPGRLLRARRHHLFVTANAAASAMVYEIDPKEMLGSTGGA